MEWEEIKYSTASVKGENIKSSTKLVTGKNSTWSNVNKMKYYEKHDDVCEKGEGRNSVSKGSLTVSGQRRLIQLLFNAGAI